jgi:hypothetical protein
MTKLESLMKERMSLAIKLDKTSVADFMLVAAELQRVIYEIYLIELEAEKKKGMQ